MTIWSKEIYATSDEVLFLQNLSQRNPAAFTRYADLVTKGMRVYPETVNVQTVLTAIRELGGGRG
jgi:hypothetical protein